MNIKIINIIFLIYLIFVLPANVNASNSISISPNPIVVCDGSGSVVVTVTANASVNYDIRIGGPNGDLFAQQVANTQTVKETGNWVTDGMVFYLVNTQNKEILGSIVANFSSQNCPNTLIATPNPIIICSGSTASTTITANASVNYDIRIGGPNGDLFAQQVANTQTVKETGNWVTDGMVFYLVNSANKNVLKTVKIDFNKSSCPTLISLNPNPIKSCFNNIGATTVNAWAPVDYEVRINSPAGDLFSKQLANNTLQQTTDKWVTNGMKFYVIDSNTKNVLNSVSATTESLECDVSNQYSQFNNIKSITWYEFGPTYSQSLLNLQKDISRIKQAGFNTIWLVTPWSELNPKPLSNPPVYNNDNFTSLKKTLDVVRDNKMQVILGLNYLGKGWSPEGIDYCNWVSDSQQYKAFTTYVNEFLYRVDGYQDVINLLVFTENAEPCNLHSYSDSSKIADILKSTLGNLPNQISPSLRSKFKIGYHDYNLLNLGWSKNNSPISSPNPFDFVSMVVYDLGSKNDDEIRKEINSRAWNFKSIYPNTPLIIGELGIRSCNKNEDLNQSRAISKMVNTAKDNKFGFNIWSWKPVSLDECNTQLSGYGYAILNNDGTPKQSAISIANILGGTINPLLQNNTPVNTNITNPTINIPLPITPNNQTTTTPERQPIPTIQIPILTPMPVNQNLVKQPSKTDNLPESAVKNKIEDLQYKKISIVSAGGEIKTDLCNTRFVFNKNLKLRSRDDEVKNLQRFLNCNGFFITISGEGSLGNETNYFGKKTQEALVRYQEANYLYILKPLNLIKGTGVFGDWTRGFVNSNN